MLTSRGIQAKLALRGLLTAVLMLVAGGAGAQRPVTIGIVADGLGKRCFICTPVLVREVRALLGGEFDVRFPQDKLITGDWTLAAVRSGLDRLLRDRAVDVILAVGPLAAAEAAARGPLPKPVIAPLVIDPSLQGLPLQKGASGVRNFTYVVPVRHFERDVAALRRIVEFRRLAILIDRSLIDAFPELQGKAQQAAREHGFEAQMVAADDNVYGLLGRLPDGIDAVLVTPLLRLDEADLRALASALLARKLPSLSMLGRVEVELGLLASSAADDDALRLARRVALNVQRVLLGEEPAAFPVAIGQRERLVINMETLRGLGLSPSWEVLTEAYKLFEEPEQGPQLTLRRAIDIALQTNLELAAGRYDVRLAEDDIAVARSRLRPQLELGAQALVIDDDRAAASFGQQPERTTTATATLSQVIYADAANADVSIRSHLLEAARNTYSAAELDVVRDTSSAFLDVLRARSLERVRIDNLETTRANLDLAESRESIGMAGPTEVIRWQREIAENLKSLAEARSTRRRAEAQLNRLLHSELDRELSLADLNLANAGLLATDPRVARRVDNPAELQILSRFMVAEGVRNSTELLSLDASIAAQQRAVLSARRTRWPTVSAQAQVGEQLSEDGAGAGVDNRTDDTEWSVALNLSLPLYRGGGIGADLQQQRSELLRLQAQRAALAEQIEARVVDAMFALHASYPSIEYSARAADAARRNLDSVSDAYSKGAVSILDVLDAQNVALASNEAAAVSEYQVLGDFFDLQRAVGQFDYLLSDAQRAAWFERLEQAFAERNK